MGDFHPDGYAHTHTQEAAHNQWLIQGRRDQPACSQQGLLWNVIYYLRTSSESGQSLT